MTWTKQKDDIVVDGVYVSKARIINESAITPATRIIQNVGIASTTIFVQSIRPLFDDSTEAYTGNDLNLVIVDEDSPKVAAAATATVSDTGTVSLTLGATGLGYTQAPVVAISSVGVSSVATATVTVSAAGTVTALTLTGPGAGYTNTSVPQVLIGQPTGFADTLGTPVLKGDFGIISGIAATTVGTAVTGLVFDLWTDLIMRDTDRVGAAVSLPQIEAGDFFYVYDSSVGSGVTSYEDAEGTSAVGVGTTFIDNIYRAQVVEYAVRDVVGVGTTGVQRVTVSVSSSESITAGMNSFYGRYSFGKLTGVTRDSNPGAFNIVNTNGITGLATAPVIRRLKNIKRLY